MGFDLLAIFIYMKIPLQYVQMAFVKYLSKNIDFYNKYCLINEKMFLPLQRKIVNSIFGWQMFSNECFIGCSRGADFDVSFGRFSLFLVKILSLCRYVKNAVSGVNLCAEYLEKQNICIDTHTILS